MRKAALLALPLLALSPPAAQAAILELSFDATVTAVDDPESLHGYTALLGQQGQVSIQIDLDAMPAFATSDDGYWNMREAASVDSDWLKVSAQIGDRQLRTADLSGGAYDSISSVLDIIHMYAQETPAESFGGGVLVEEYETNRQGFASFSLGATPALPEALRQMNASLPFTFIASWASAGFQNIHGACGEGSAYASCSLIGEQQAFVALAGADNSLVTARLLETPLPATAWLFGSALLGLGARRLAQR